MINKVVRCAHAATSAGGRGRVRRRRRGGVLAIELRLRSIQRRDRHRKRRHEVELERVRIKPNGTDAFVKFKTRSYHTALSMYVEAGKKATFDSVPEGEYQLVFATGSVYSHTCGKFMEDMRVQAFRDFESFRTVQIGNEISTVILSVTLHSVPEGHVRTQPYNFDRFMAD